MITFYKRKERESSVPRNGILLHSRRFWAEIDRRVRPNKPNRGLVVSQSSFLGGFECPKPKTNRSPVANSTVSFTAPDLSRPFPPRPLPHSSELLLKPRRNPDLKPRLSHLGGIGWVDDDLLDEPLPFSWRRWFGVRLIVFAAGRIGGLHVGEWYPHDSLHRETELEMWRSYGVFRSLEFLKQWLVLIITSEPHHHVAWSWRYFDSLSEQVLLSRLLKFIAWLIFVDMKIFLFIELNFFFFLKF